MPLISILPRLIFKFENLFLFLQEKKGRLYLVTALSDTKVDLKVLSARLGAGKGGVRLAPDELLPTILGVPLGSVTPLAVSRATATDVVLLLDEKLKSESSFFVHPLDNTASLPMTATDLEAFLTSIGRQAIWVDLEADPKIDKDNPPDLKSIADAAKAIATNDGDAAAAPSATAPAAPAAAKKDKKKGGDAKGAKKEEKGGAPAVRAACDVFSVADSVMGKIAAGMGVDATGVNGDVMRKLRADVVMELNALRNTAYAAGFKAAQSTVVAHITRELA